MKITLQKRSSSKIQKCAMRSTRTSNSLLLRSSAGQTNRKQRRQEQTNSGLKLSFRESKKSNGVSVKLCRQRNKNMPSTG